MRCIMADDKDEFILDFGITCKWVSQLQASSALCWSNKASVNNGQETRWPENATAGAGFSGYEKLF
jgi:hypothetical protein